MTDKADNDALVRDELAAMRKREVQLIGAGISMRDWHATEIGYNQLRDRIDGFILCLAALRTPQLDETETRAEVVRLNGKLLDIKRRCLRHPDDTPEDDTRDKRIAYTIASEALKGTDHGRG